MPAPGKYTKITEGTGAKIHNGMLYVRQTNMINGMLESGGYADRVYQMPYAGTLKDAMKINHFGISAINRCIETGLIVNIGRLIR